MPTLIFIAGPTASGKTALSIAVAKHFNAEIISADARQFYKGMDMGTAKATSQEQSEVPHHFIDTLDPDQEYTAGQFEKDVLAFLHEYFKLKEVAVLVGGSGLYLKAITEGFDDLPYTPPEIRMYFNKQFEVHGLSKLQGMLKEQDPEYYDTVDINNRQRVQRALEAMKVSGKRFSELWHKQSKQRPFDMLKVLISPEREALYERINRRVDEMISHGLVEEARQFYPLKDANALQTLGYKELFEHFDGQVELDHAIDKIKQHTRNYAKRQFTWFKNQDGYTVFENPDPDAVIRHLEEQMNV